MLYLSFDVNESKSLPQLQSGDPRNNVKELKSFKRKDSTAIEKLYSVGQVIILNEMHKMKYVILIKLG